MKTFYIPLSGIQYGAGVQKAQCERIGTVVDAFGHWIPAFAGMT